MPLQYHLYNGLTRPADYSIFVRDMTDPPACESVLAQEWICPVGQRTGLLPSWLASMTGPVYEPMLARDRQRDSGTGNVQT